MAATHTFAAALVAAAGSLSLQHGENLWKGGHGGARSGAGNKLGHWEAQGGRAATAIAKVERGAKAKAVAEAMKRKAQDRWRLWAASSGTQQSSSEQQQPAKPAAEQVAA